MVAALKLPLHSQCVKYLLFIFNLLFVITGIILLSIGAVIHGIYHNYQHFLDNKFYSVPSLLMAVGLIIFFIAFFGCCGAVRENYCMILTFSSLLALVFILEFSGGIAGYVLRSRTSEVLETKMLKTMGLYNQSSPGEITTAWDLVQTQFNCCGTHDATDWSKMNLAYTNDTLPSTCCLTHPITCKFKERRGGGCFPHIVYYIKAHAAQLGGVGLAIAFIQAIGVWFSIFLARSIRNTYETV